VTISTPEGLQQTISDGLIAARREEDGVNLLQITAPISHGSSGGPVIDESGDVVGIVVGLFENGQNLNFAIPVSVAQRLLSQLQSSSQVELPEWPTRPKEREFTSKYQDGLAAFQRGDFNAAAGLFSAAQKLRPDNPAAQFAAAVSWERLSEIENEEKAYRRYLSLKPEDSERVAQAQGRLHDIALSKRRITGLLTNIKLDATIYVLADDTIQGFMTLDSERACSIKGKHENDATAVVCTDPSGDRIAIGWDGSMDEGQHSGTIYYLKAGDTAKGDGTDFPFWLAKVEEN
jgi:tetratricopeptide (TPR) repeat protein